VTVKEARHQAAKTLAAHAIEDAPLEAELLLMHVLSIDRTHLYVRLEDELLPGLRMSSCPERSRPSIT